MNYLKVLKHKFGPASYKIAPSSGKITECVIW